MKLIGDHPELLPRMGAIQRGLVAKTYRMARTASALQQVPRDGSADEVLAVILRAACEHLGFDRAYAYQAQGDHLPLLLSWGAGAPTSRGGSLVRRAIRTGAPVIARKGRVVIAPLLAGGEVIGALRLEADAPASLPEVLPALERLVAAAVSALANAILRERIRAQGREIAGLSARLIEANHRIKNNLQALAGFLAADVSQPAGLDMSTHSRGRLCHMGRIKAIAALHDALAHCADERPDLGALTGRICADTAAVSPAGERVRVVVAARAVEAEVRTCQAYALVLHELVSNALHHAYPSGEGEIRVSLRAGDGVAVLEVADRGVGLPASSGRSGQGLEIAHALAENELGGRLEMSGGNGTTARLQFALRREGA